MREALRGERSFRGHVRCQSRNSRRERERCESQESIVVGRHLRGDRGKKGMGLTVRHVAAVRKGARVPRGLSTRDRHPHFTLSGPCPSPRPPPFRCSSGTVLDIRSPAGKFATPIRRDFQF